MSRFRFAPASPDELIVHGAQRPGYNSIKSIGAGPVGDWISFMTEHGIQRVCCLLPSEQLAYYTVDLIAQYRDFFGPDNVRSARVPDFELCSSGLLETVVLPFLAESDRKGMAIVVHCSGGSGRTGHVLAAWLVQGRGFSVDEALSTVRKTGRNPWEAVENWSATEEELRQLLAGGKT